MRLSINIPPFLFNFPAAQCSSTEIWLSWDVISKVFGVTLYSRLVFLCCSSLTSSPNSGDLFPVNISELKVIPSPTRCLYSLKASLLLLLIRCSSVYFIYLNFFLFLWVITTLNVHTPLFFFGSPFYVRLVCYLSLSLLPIYYFFYQRRYHKKRDPGDVNHLNTFSINSRIKLKEYNSIAFNLYTFWRRKIKASPGDVSILLDTFNVNQERHKI